VNCYRITEERCDDEGSQIICERAGTNVKQVNIQCWLGGERGLAGKQLGQKSMIERTGRRTIVAGQEQRKSAGQEQRRSAVGEQRRSAVGEQRRSAGQRSQPMRQGRIAGRMMLLLLRG
jgi:hypothetical protein